MIYAAHHHFGGDEIGSGVPERPFLGVSTQDEGDLKDLVEDWFGRLVQ
jgi:phage gpG-like protein